MDLFADLKKNHTNMVAAQALFFHSGKHIGLRVECPSIGKEFTDGIALGTDPEGWLFFDDIDAFDDDTEYEITQITNPSDDRTCARIKFSTKATGRVYAQFLGTDAAEVVDSMQMNGLKRTGKWNELRLGAATAIVKKIIHDATVVMEVDAIKMRATFKDTKGIFNAKTKVRSHGMFSFKDEDTIKEGVIANYNNDRIVFYKAHAHDFVGYFIPFEYSDVYINKLGGIDTEFKNVDWKKL